MSAEIKHHAADLKLLTCSQATHSHQGCLQNVTRACRDIVAAKPQTRSSFGFAQPVKRNTKSETGKLAETAAKPPLYSSRRPGKHPQPSAEDGWNAELPSAAFNVLPVNHSSHPELPLDLISSSNNNASNAHMCSPSPPSSHVTSIFVQSLPTVSHSGNQLQMPTEQGRCSIHKSC
ncbi:TPA: hypothetical protein ACH3X2_002914 [Trebouxia sp. C0005]